MPPPFAPAQCSLVGVPVRSFLQHARSAPSGARSAEVDEHDPSGAQLNVGCLRVAALFVVGVQPTS
jgi:hypothetical protein